MVLLPTVEKQTMYRKVGRGYMCGWEAEGSWLQHVMRVSPDTAHVHTVLCVCVCGFCVYVLGIARLSAFCLCRQVSRPVCWAPQGAGPRENCIWFVHH